MQSTNFKRVYLSEMSRPVDNLKNIPNKRMTSSSLDLSDELLSSFGILEDAREDFECFNNLQIADEICLWKIEKQWSRSKTVEATKT